MIDKAFAREQYKQHGRAAFHFEGRPPSRNRRQIIVHSQPILYHDGNDLQDIAIDLQQDANGYYEDRNSLRFRVRPDGTAQYRLDGHTLSIRPAAALALDLQDNIKEQVVSSLPTVTDRNTGAEVEQRGILDGVRFKHIVQPGRVKEYAILDRKPTVAPGADLYAIGYQYQSNTLTPQIAGRELFWNDASGAAVMVFPAPMAFDALGRRSRLSYKIRGNWIAVVVPLAIIENAVYPFMIDPTTVQADAQANLVVIEKPSADEYHTLFFRFALPELTETLATADLRLVVSSSTPPSQASNYTMYAEDEGTSWTDGSNESTMETIKNSIEGSTKTFDDDLLLSVGTHNIDAFGGTGYGLKGLYDGSTTPNPVTVKLTDTTANIFYDDTDSGSTLRLDGFAGFALIEARSDVTDYPRLVLETEVATTGTPYHYNQRRRAS